MGRREATGACSGDGEESEAAGFDRPLFMTYGLISGLSVLLTIPWCLMATKTVALKPTKSTTLSRSELNSGLERVPHVRPGELRSGLEKVPHG